jgi:hypothetical protein
MKTIHIFQQHTHAGETFPAGSDIELPDEDADFLLRLEGERRAQIVKAQAEYEALKQAAADDR